MKRTYKINGQIIKTKGCAIKARQAYNRKNPNDKLQNASDAWEFKEIKESK